MANNKTSHGMHARDDAGFSLIETMIAMAILATGLLSLAGVFIMGLNHLNGSSGALIAREKAREAVESVHTARDTRVITWCQIYNVSSARGTACATAPTGVFADGPQPLLNAGDDGLVNTADDDGVEEALNPGPDNVLGTDDDVRTPLTGYTREIVISEILDGNGNANANLRRLNIRVRYGRMVRNSSGESQPERVYELTTYISAIS
jgi:prepilin-type N-terminal cleavage/methylation domain-containing protein